MYSQVRLINEIFTPENLKNASIVDKYNYFNKIYKKNKYILMNNVDIFGPYPRSDVPWDISEAQKIATYNPEVTKVLNWIKAEIIVKLSSIDYRTLGVLTRIATGMLNKCNIPKEIQIMFHDNLIENLRSEYSNIITADLPFLP